MTANFSDTTPAFLRLLREANGRYDVVERALVSARTNNGGKTPSLDQVIRELRDQHD